MNQKSVASRRMTVIQGERERETEVGKGKWLTSESTAPPHLEWRGHALQRRRRTASHSSKPGVIRSDGKRPTRLIWIPCLETKVDTNCKMSNNI